METFDMFLKRPAIAFSSRVPALADLGLNPQSSLQHRFFTDCFMKFSVSPGFCKWGYFEPVPFYLRQPAIAFHTHFREQAGQIEVQMRCFICRGGRGFRLGLPAAAMSANLICLSRRQCFQDRR